MKNVIFIVLDTLRKDRLGIFGNPRNATPFLDEFANHCVNFTNAYANSAWTPPTHASMLTGLLPIHHLVDGDNINLEKKHHFLFSILKKNNYNTASIVVNPYLYESTGFMRDFDIRLELGRKRQYKPYSLLLLRAINKITKAYPSLSSKLILENTKRVLKTLCSSNKPFGIFLNLTQVHSKYDPPRKFLNSFEKYFVNLDEDEKHLVAYICDRGGYEYMAKESPLPDKVIEGIKLLYDAELLFLDSMLRDFFDFIKINKVFSHTTIIIISDHGENLGENGMFYHQFNLSPNLIRIPLLIRDPDLTPKAVNENVAQIDILPSLCDALEIENNEVIDGLSFFLMK